MAAPLGCQVEAPLWVKAPESAREHVENAVIWGQLGPLYAAAIRMIETPRRYGIELTLDF